MNHRRNVSNSEIKSDSSDSSPLKFKPSLILPDSLNSSAMQPHPQNEGNTFVDMLDSSIKHFTSISAVANPLKQIVELKNQIAFYNQNLEIVKNDKMDLNSKLMQLRSKSSEIEEENKKLSESLQDLKGYTEKLKVSLQKAENELKSVSRKNQLLEGSVVRRENKAMTFVKKENFLNSSNDEIDVFNAEENTCMQFSDFQFANPSPKIQGKSLYQRIPVRK